MKMMMREKRRSKRDVGKGREQDRRNVGVGFEETLSCRKDEQGIGASHARKTTTGLVSCSRGNETSLNTVPSHCRPVILWTLSVQTHPVFQTHYDGSCETFLQTSKHPQRWKRKQVCRHQTTHWVAFFFFFLLDNEGFDDEEERRDTHQV